MSIRSRHRKRGTPRATPLDLLPAAVQAKPGMGVKVIDVSKTPMGQMGMGGISGFDPVKNLQVIIAPSGDTAKERVVRWHEAMHLNIKASRMPTKKKVRERFSDLVWNLAGDLVLHADVRPFRLGSRRKNYFGNEQLIRDCLAVAWMDIRAALRNVPPRDASVGMLWASYVITVIRGWMLTCNPGGIYHSNPVYFRAPYLERNCRAFPYTKAAKTFGMIPSGLRKVLKDVRKAAENQDLELVAELIAPFFVLPDNYKGKYGDSVDVDKDLKFEERRKELDAHKIMEIKDLQRTEWSNRRALLYEKVTLSHGMRIRTRRLAVCASTDSTARLFHRKKRYPGRDVVLIDASGSMHVDPKTLNQLCATAPGATVAYYSGAGSDGQLFVYAKDGKRYDSKQESDLPRYAGGNTVDYWALDWAEKEAGREGHITFVTDGAFCGGPDNQEQVAMELLQRKLGKGQLTWIGTIEEAQKAFEDNNVA